MATVETRFACETLKEESGSVGRSSSSSSSDEESSTEEIFISRPLRRCTSNTYNASAALEGVTARAWPSNWRSNSTESGKPTEVPTKLSVSSLQLPSHGESSDVYELTIQANGPSHNSEEGGEFACPNVLDNSHKSVSQKVADECRTNDKGIQLISDIDCGIYNSPRESESNSVSKIFDDVIRAAASSERETTVEYAAAPRSELNNEIADIFERQMSPAVVEQKPTHPAESNTIIQHNLLLSSNFAELKRNKPSAEKCRDTKMNSKRRNKGRLRKGRKWKPDLESSCLQLIYSTLSDRATRLMTLDGAETADIERELALFENSMAVHSDDNNNENACIENDSRSETVNMTCICAEYHGSLDARLENVPSSVATAVEANTVENGSKTEYKDENSDIKEIVTAENKDHLIKTVNATECGATKNKRGARFCEKTFESKAAGLPTNRCYIDDSYFDILAPYEHHFFAADTSLLPSIERLLPSIAHVDVRRLRSKNKWHTTKARIQVKTKYCVSVKNSVHGRKYYVHHRVAKRMPLLPSDWSADNHPRSWIQSLATSCVYRKKVSNKEDNFVPNWRNPPRGVNKREPVPKYAVNRQNADQTLDSDLVNILISLQDRELSPADYELLLRLDERVKPPTFDAKQLDSLRTDVVGSDVIESDVTSAEVTADDVTADDAAKGDANAELCAVCMEAYKGGQRRKYLPCGHRFHEDCIVGWLTSSSKMCPLDGKEVEL